MTDGEAKQNREEEIVAWARRVEAHAEAEELRRDVLRMQRDGDCDVRIFDRLRVRMTKQQVNEWESFCSSHPATAALLEAVDDLDAAKGCNDLPYADKRQKMRDARAKLHAATIAAVAMAKEWCDANGVAY